MTMRTADHIISVSRGNVGRTVLYAESHGADRPDECADYIMSVYDLCLPDDMPDASVVIAQSAHETGEWESFWWNERLNPAGLGITGDPAQNAASPTFASGEEAARAHVSHLLVYALGPADAGSLWFRRTGRSITEDDPRYEAYLNAYGNTIQAETIAELAGTWATDTAYAQKVCARGNMIYPGLPDQEDAPMPTGKPVIVIDAGHRSTDRTGNPFEMALTDDLAFAYVEELRLRNYDAYWYQRDLDQDSDPDETIGDLNTVAKGLGAWLSQQPWALMISCHYNGAHSPLHAIVPDNVNLSTAYPEGRNPNDTAANNPLDRKLGQEIVGRMAASGLGGLFHGKLEPGLMSETETGVGLQGFRLAVMAATCPSRLTAVRLVVEHGGTDDPAARRFADFAKAAADAIDAVYASTPSTTTTAPPTPPPLVKRIPIVEPAGTTNGTFFFGDRLYQKVSPSRLKLIREAVQYARPDGKSLASTATLPKGKVVTMAYTVAGDDGDLYRASKAGTYIRAANFTERRT